MAGEVAQQQQAQQAQAQIQAEAWRQSLPQDLREKPIDEIVKWGNSAHTQLGSLNKDLGGYKTKISELEANSKRYEDTARQYQQGVNEWAQFYKQHVEPDWGEFEKWKGSRAQRQQQQQFEVQPGQGDDPFKEWESKSPAEQAQILRAEGSRQTDERFQTMRGEYDQGWKQFQKGLQDYVADRERYFGTLLQLRDKVWSEKIKNPNFDADAAIQEGIKALSGGYDPLDLGIKLSTMNKGYEEKLAESKKLWEAEQTAAQEAARIVTPPTSGAPMVARTRPLAGLTSAGVREAAAKSLVEKYGAGIF